MSRKKNNAWLTSFGDMLTLLLCFFISTISLGPYGTKQIDGEISKTEQALGIDIANPHLDNLIRLVDIDEASFLAAQDQPLLDLPALLEKQVDPAVYRVKSISIETCHSATDSFEGQSWHVSMTRALTLRRQLLDSNLVAEPVNLRSLGPWCEVIGGYEKANKIAARLYLYLEQIET